MTTLEVLFEQYGQRMTIPVDEARLANFPELSWNKFRRELFAGAIDLPVIIYRNSQKTGLFVDVRDPAAWSDMQRTKAERDLKRLKVAA